MHLVLLSLWFVSADASPQEVDSGDDTDSPADASGDGTAPATGSDPNPRTGPAEPEPSSSPPVDPLQLTGREDLHATVQRHQRELAFCYERELRADRSVAGRVEIAWSVADTRVTSTRVVANTTGKARLARCMTDKIAKWRFPDTVQGSTSWPFVFRKR